MDLAVYTEKGKQIAATFQPDQDMEAAVVSFADSMAESQMLSGCHFFKVMVDGELEYVLLTRSPAEDAYMVGRLAVCQIRNLVSAYMEQFDRNNFMQNILLGNMLVVDMYNKAKKLHIEQTERVVFVIDLENSKDSAAMELVKNLFMTRAKDFVTEVDEQSIILIKDTEELQDDEKLDALAAMIVDNMHTEAMVRARVGYGNRVTNLQDIARSYQEAKMALEVGRIFYAEKETVAYRLQDIARSYQEAKMALEVGRIFYAEKETVAYRYLGIGRLIYQLPMSLCEMFIHEVFGDEIPDVFQEETTTTIQKFFENNLNGIGRLIYQLPMSLCEMFIHEVFGDEIPDVFQEETTTTIQKFFENNLNISETARQLYVHRNTLVYRLERLQKIIGLDIRRFDDAMTFKIAMMVISHMQYVEERQ